MSDIIVSGSHAVSSGRTLDNGDNMYVSAGGSAVSTTVSAGGFQGVDSGGTAISTTLDGGIVYVSSGGEAASATVNNGGTEEVFNRGTILATMVNSGGAAEVLAGGTASATKVSAHGIELVYASGTASDTTVLNGGTQDVQSGGTTVGTRVDSLGAEYVAPSGTASNTTVEAGGYEFVYKSSSEIGGTVNGVEYLFSGATATGVAVSNGGSVEINSGGTASKTTLGNSGYDFVFSNGAAVSTTVSSGGIEYVYSGGHASFTTVSNGGFQNVSSGGSAVATMVSKGGVEFAYSRGSVSATEVLSGGVEVVSSAGSATGTEVSLGGAIDDATLAYATGGTASVTAADVLSVTIGAGSYRQQLTGSYADEYFHLSPGQYGGTEITLEGTPCYCRGTFISTDRGDVAIEDLAIGDRVMTLAGVARPIRWIGRRAYAGRFAAGNQEVLPVLVRRDALADGVPRRDLFVSPLHAMHLDGVLIPAIALVNGGSIVQPDAPDQVEYFHLELDSHDIIFAEGAAAETFVDDGSRGMFHNAADFFASYPDAPRVPLRYCAPRVEDGALLAAVQRRLAKRGGAPSADRGPPGPLRGFLDDAGRDRIAGWAQDLAKPSAPVQLVVRDNGVPIARVLANRYRADLARAGIGNGHAGFDILIPGGLSPLLRHVIQVARESDGAGIAGSPAVIEAADCFSSSLEQVISNAVAAVGPDVEQERVLAFLLGQADRLAQRRADQDGRRSERLAWQRSRHRAGPPAAADPSLRALVLDALAPTQQHALAELGYSVSFVAADDMAAAGPSGVALCGLPFYASAEEVLRRQADCFAVVWLCGVAMATRYLGLARRYQPRARILLGVGELREAPLAACVAAWSADAVLTGSEATAALLRRAVPDARVYCDADTATLRAAVA